MGGGGRCRSSVVVLGLFSVFADARGRSWVLMVGGWRRSCAFVHFASWWADIVCGWLWWPLCSLVGLGCGLPSGGGGCLTSYGDGIVVG